jgi:hypothetical protein
LKNKIHKGIKTKQSEVNLSSLYQPSKRNIAKIKPESKFSKSKQLKIAYPLCKQILNYQTPTIKQTIQKISQISFLNYIPI